MRLKAQIEKHRLGGSGLTSDLDDLRDEIQETLAQQATQIDEIHERLDFAEGERAGWRSLARHPVRRCHSPRPVQHDEGNPQTGRPLSR